MFKQNFMKVNLNTLAALVLALAHRDTAVCGFWTSKKETELRLRVAKSNAFHLHQLTMIKSINNTKIKKFNQICISYITHNL